MAKAGQREQKAKILVFSLLQNADCQGNQGYLTKPREAKCFQSVFHVNNLTTPR